MGKKLKKFTKNHKKEVDRKMHNTTIFDCLYRLRIKSNYEEAETYILSQMSSSDADELYESLRTILNCCLLSIENLIKGYLGDEKFNKIRDEIKSKIKREEFRNESIFLREQYLG